MGRAVLGLEDGANVGEELVGTAVVGLRVGGEVGEELNAVGL